MAHGILQVATNIFKHGRILSDVDGVGASGHLVQLATLARQSNGLAMVPSMLLRRRVSCTLITLIDGRFRLLLALIIGQSRRLIHLLGYIGLLDMSARRSQGANLATTLAHRQPLLQIYGCVEYLTELLLLHMPRNIHVVHVVVDVALVTGQSHKLILIASLGFFKLTALHDGIVGIRTEEAILSEIAGFLASTLNATVLLQGVHLHVVRCTIWHGWNDADAIDGSGAGHLRLVTAWVIELHLLLTRRGDVLRMVTERRLPDLGGRLRVSDWRLILLCFSRLLIGNLLLLLGVHILKSILLKD